MSQARVTDFFATRKRNRFNQDEILLNKQKKTHQLIDTSESKADEIAQIKEKLAQVAASSERCLRSRTKLENDQKEEAPPAPVKRGKKKEQLEALKAKMNRLDEKIAKVVHQEPEAAKIEVKEKKKLNKAELKQKIEQFNKNLLEIQQIEEKPETKNETKEEEKVIPAYEKFKDLADEHLDTTSTLTLPKSYSLLLDSFKGSDTIIKFLFNRDEICTFLKLKMGIQNITKHTFYLKHLAQIKHVYQEAYLYKQEKIFIDFKNDYHLIISPNMNEIESNKDTGLKQFTPMVLLKRLKKFKQNLFNIVKKLHEEFLKSIGISDIPLENIKRWHQKFDLENLPEISESELPKAPVDQSIKCKTGKELLNIAKDIYSSRVQDAIKNTVVPNEEKPVAEKPSKEDDLTLNPDQKVINKLKEKKETSYNALLDKIRAKEKQKALENMIINNDKEKMTSKYNSYKDIVRFLLFYYQSEKKSTLEMDKVCKKVADSTKGNLNELECRELITEMSHESKHLNLFINADSGKKWLNIIKVRNVQYIQMDKSFQLNDLNLMIDKALEELNSS